MGLGGGRWGRVLTLNCQFAEHLHSSVRILIRPMEAGFGMSLEYSWGCDWQRLSQPGVERFAQAKKSWLFRVSCGHKDLD